MKTESMATERASECATDALQTLKPFLDEAGRIKVWPSKQDRKREILAYLSEKFEGEKHYTEREVNALINEWHTFGDFFLLRRGLIDHKFLSRTPNGATYWRSV